MDARIGQLNGGRFYAYANGYNAEPTIGTLAEVETALGLRAATPAPKRAESKVYSVLVRFEHPAWDEQDGIEYAGILAASKADANRIARRRAYDDGHTVGRRAYFTATAAE